MEWLKEIFSGTMIVAILFLVLAAWIWTIIAITQNRNIGPGKKIIWILIVVFVAPLLGTVIYFLTRKK